MIKRYEIRPRRKRTMNGNGNGVEPAAPPREPPPAVAGPLTPAGALEEK